VFKTKAMENRRLQIMHVYLVFSHVVSKVIGCAVRDAGFDAAARQPNRK